MISGPISHSVQVDLWITWSNILFLHFRKFLNNTFKSSKRAETPTDFHDVDDSDDEKPFAANSSGTTGSNANNRNVRLFSTPQHNPNNPFNATPERTHPRPPVHYK